MASKKESSYNIFRNVCQRAMLVDDYIYMNHTIISSNSKEKYSVILSIEDKLWNDIISDEEFKSHMREYDPINDPAEIKTLFSYQNEIDKADWIELDCDALYAGKVMKIEINGIEYDIPVCKSLIPLKLKKNEYNNIRYKIIKGNQIALILNKKFILDENSSFEISRIFYIL